VARGGRRNRSGPPLDPQSGRSEARGVRLTALPSQGWTGSRPAWPLEQVTDRERVVWAEVWRTPQAAAWAQQSWRWPTVALYVRVRVQCEEPEVPASLFTVLHRFADQIGMTPAGLRDNGWAIADDELGRRAAEKAAADAGHDQAAAAGPVGAVPARRRPASARDRIAGGAGAAG
jgi:hypothetical protein